MGFELPVGYFRILHVIGALGFAFLAVWAAPNRRALALVWLLSCLALIAASLLPIRPVFLEAPPGLGISLVVMLGSPIALALATGLSVAWGLSIRDRQPSYPLRVALVALAYPLGYALSQLLLPGFPLFSLS